MRAFFKTMCLCAAKFNNNIIFHIVIYIIGGGTYGGTLAAHGGTLAAHGKRES
jgi:hypothetical protein